MPGRQSTFNSLTYTFRVRLRGVATHPRIGASLEPGARYPRVVGRHGDAPPQYRAVDEVDEQDGAVDADQPA